MDSPESPVLLPKRVHHLEEASLEPPFCRKRTNRHDASQSLPETAEDGALGGAHEPSDVSGRLNVAASHKKDQRASPARSTNRNSRVAQVRVRKCEQRGWDHEPWYGDEDDHEGRQQAEEREDDLLHTHVESPANRVSGPANQDGRDSMLAHQSTVSKSLENRFRILPTCKSRGL